MLHNHISIYLIFSLINNLLKLSNNFDKIEIYCFVDFKTSYITQRLFSVSIIIIFIWTRLKKYKTCLKILFLLMLRLHSSIYTLKFFINPLKHTF